MEGSDSVSQKDKALRQANSLVPRWQHGNNHTAARPLVLMHEIWGKFASGHHKPFL